ncbi:hypothetical protein HN682_09650 [Candidatus Peregrinibacteria bacterium]|jgi:hypothetical protein|nr:hypothetical protein [Candidatus Peregrinibacteria bacterium]
MSSNIFEELNLNAPKFYKELIADIENNHADIRGALKENNINRKNRFNEDFIKKHIVIFINYFAKLRLNRLNTFRDSFPSNRRPIGRIYPVDLTIAKKLLIVMVSLCKNFWDYSAVREFILDNYEHDEKLLKIINQKLIEAANDEYHYMHLSKMPIENAIIYKRKAIDEFAKYFEELNVLENSYKYLVGEFVREKLVFSGSYGESYIITKYHIDAFLGYVDCRDKGLDFLLKALDEISCFNVAIEYEEVCPDEYSLFSACQYFISEISKLIFKKAQSQDDFDDIRNYYDDYDSDNFDLTMGEIKAKYIMG